MIKYLDRIYTKIKKKDNFRIALFLVILPIAVKRIKKQIKKKDLLMSPLPQLVKATPQGGTIHEYQLTGGKTSFMRYLGCYLGTCKFCNDMEEASEFVSSIEVSPKTL